MAQAFYKPDGSLAITEQWNPANYTTTQESSGRPMGATGTHSFKIVQAGAAARYAVSIDDAGTPSGDVQVVIRAYFEHTDPAADMIRAHVHGGGSAGAEDGYFITFAATGGQLLREYDGGVQVAHDTNSSPLADANEWVRIRLDRSGSTIQAKTWIEPNNEPGSYQMSASDASHSSGWVGFAGAIQSGTLWVDWIGVGTDGDEAPMEPLAAAGHGMLLSQYRNRLVIPG